MAYLLVENFVYGMDRRRKRVAGVPGTLWDGCNVHITRGGDIERRKKFVPEYAVPGTFGAAVVRSQLYVFGSADLASSMPIGIQYQRLQAPSAAAMVDVLAVKAFAGKLYVIAEYADGNIHHFYDGARVTDWDVIGAAGADFTTIASAFVRKLNASTEVEARAFGASLTLTAREAGVPFTIAQATTNGGSTADQTITLTTVQANVAGVEEVLASGSFTITGGSEDRGVNTVRSVKVNGVELLSNEVDWTGSHASTAIRVAAEINFGTPTHHYSAEATGATVTIKATAGSGATPNGYAIELLPHGDVVLDGDAALAGGVSAVSAVKQVVKATFGGTFEAADGFKLTVNGVDYLVTGLASGTGRSLYVSDQRVWSPVGSIWRYSMLNRADIWDPAHTPLVTDNDAGFLNVSSDTEGNEDLLVAARYQDRAAVLSETTVVLYKLDTNPANFAYVDTLESTGTRAPDSVKRYGNNDCFYLDVSGIRSLRARDSSNAPFVSDIGNAIDTFVAETLAGMTGEQVFRAVAEIEPIDGRYILFAGGVAFVLSYFPGAKITAWTYYDLEEFDGARVQAAVRVGNRLVARAGEYLWVYGGNNGDVYPDDDEIVGTVKLPFLSGKTPATIKALKGFDSAATNVWEAQLAFDPNHEDRSINIGRVGEITFADPNSIAVPGQTSMVALEMFCRTAGPADISMVAIHYEGDKAE